MPSAHHPLSTHLLQRHPKQNRRLWSAAASYGSARTANFWLDSPCDGDKIPKSTRSPSPLQGGYMYDAWKKITPQGEITFAKEGAPQVGFVYTMKTAGKIVRELSHSGDLTHEQVESRFTDNVVLIRD
jgi:hypothetical protein